MSVALHVGDRAYELGSAAFLNAFFSTVFVRVECNQWGSRFPVLMTELYSGEVPAAHVGVLLEELRSLREALATLPPDAVVWDHAEPTAQPPWGSEIAAHIQSMADYFVTSDGKDLIEVLQTALGGSGARRGARIA
jgi:2,3-bisphosphoglycerate-dependent phosphoglycerate mutase